MKQISLFVLLIVSMSSALSAREYSAGWELWYPYQYHSKDSRLVGVDISAFNAIMRAAKVDFTIAEIPWKTHLHFVKTGKIDMAMGASWSNDRCKYAYFSEPYRQETVKLFVRAGDRDRIQLTNLRDLASSPYIIGVESGYFYGKQYAELKKSPDFFANISEAIDIEENVSLLIKGHLDGFLADPYTVKAFVEKYKMQGQFEMHELEIYSDDIYIMLSKNSTNRHLLKRINRAIKSLQEEGKLTMPVSKTPIANEELQCTD